MGLGLISNNFAGISTPITMSISLHVLINDPENSSIFCGVLLSVQIFCSYIIYICLFTSMFYRWYIYNLKASAQNKWNSRLGFYYFLRIHKHMRKCSICGFIWVWVGHKPLMSRNWTLYSTMCVCLLCRVCLSPFFSSWTLARVSCLLTLYNLLNNKCCIILVTYLGLGIHSFGFRQHS